MATLSGRWHITVAAKNAAWDQGIEISGSWGSDGLYLLTPGDTINDVVGDEFTVVPHFHNPVIDEWNPSLERDTWRWDDAAGVTVTIYSDDNTGAGDLDFDDLVLVCTTDDPDITSRHKDVIRPDLRLPEDGVSEEPRHDW